MKINKVDSPLWVEKYRPTNIADCILPKHLEETFNGFITAGKMPNLLLSGSQGTGKTTAALALCDQLGYEVLFINGSNEGKLIDTLRSKIAIFASTVSLSSDRKCVVTDESDYMPDATQAAYRSFMEQFADTCSFIFTANFKNRLIDPLHSRFTGIDFKIPAEETALIASKFFKRACFILDDNGVKYEKAVVAALVKKFFPDWRRCINELQRYSISGVIDSGILSIADNSDVKQLMKFLKDKDFGSCKKWVFTSSNIDMVSLCRELDTLLYDQVKPQCIPGTILLYSDYQDKSTRALDPAINCLALLVELMMNLEWK